MDVAHVASLFRLITCVCIGLLSGGQGHLIRIHAEAIMYDAADLPLTDADYDIWARGLRNPFRLDVFKPTGDIYIADVGHITVEVCWLLTAHSSFTLAVVFVLGFYLLVAAPFQRGR